LVDRVGSIDLFIPHSGRETPRTYSSNIWLYVSNTYFIFG
jgi:hypothetical protein